MTAKKKTNQSKKYDRPETEKRSNTVVENPNPTIPNASNQPIDTNVNSSHHPQAGNSSRRNIESV